MRFANVNMAKTVTQSPVEPITAAQKKRAKRPLVNRDRVVRGAESSGIMLPTP